MVNDSVSDSLLYELQHGKSCLCLKTTEILKITHFGENCSVLGFLKFKVLPL